MHDAAVSEMMAGDSGNIGRVFVAYCRSQAAAPSLEGFAGYLSLKLRPSRVCLVYRCEAGDEIYYTERPRGACIYWRVKMSGRNYLLPRPVSAEQFDEIKGMVGGKASAGNEPQPTSLGECVPAVLEPRGDDWVVAQPGSLSPGAPPDPPEAAVASPALESKPPPAPTVIGRVAPAPSARASALLQKQPAFPPLVPKPAAAVVPAKAPQARRVDPTGTMPGDVNASPARIDKKLQKSPKRNSVKGRRLLVVVGLVLVLLATLATWQKWQGAGSVPSAGGGAGGEAPQVAANPAPEPGPALPKQSPAKPILPTAESVQSDWISKFDAEIGEGTRSGAEQLLKSAADMGLTNTPEYLARRDRLEATMRLIRRAEAALSDTGTVTQCQMLHAELMTNSALVYADFLTGVRTQVLQSLTLWDSLLQSERAKKLTEATNTCAALQRFVAWPELQQKQNAIKDQVVRVGRLVAAIQTAAAEPEWPKLERSIILVSELDSGAVLTNILAPYRQKLADYLEGRSIVSGESLHYARGLPELSKELEVDAASEALDRLEKARRLFRRAEDENAETAVVAAQMVVMRTLLEQAVITADRSLVQAVSQRVTLLEGSQNREEISRLIKATQVRLGDRDARPPRSGASRK